MNRIAGIGLRLLVIFIFLFPLLLGVAAAFRPDQEMFRYGGTLSIYAFVPHSPTIDNIRAVLSRPYFTQEIWNTILLAVVQSTLTVMIAVMAAFALARLHFMGRAIVFYAIVATMFVPFEAMVVPLFLVVKRFELLNSFWGLLLPWVASPVGIFLLRQAMQEIPADLEEAAIIDGAGLLRILWHVILPDTRAAMVTVWLITFIYVWDSFLWPLVIVNDPSRQLVQVGISSLFNPERIQYGLVFASALVAVGPVVVLFVFLQRFYVRSISLTGIK